MKTPVEISKFSQLMLQHLQTDVAYRELTGAEILAVLNSAAGTISAVIEAQLLAESIRRTFEVLE